MMRVHFDEKMKELELSIVKMGILIEEAIGKALRAFIKRDRNLVDQVIEGDKVIDNTERKIDMQCASIIATEQPVALDLRIIIAVLKIANDLERMGDYAEHLAIVTNSLSRESVLKASSDITQISEVAITMIRDAIQAFIKRDVDLAEEVRNRDDVADGIYARFFQEMMNYIEQSPDYQREGVALLFVSKYLERLADHATNVAEEVIFVCTGDRKDWII
jgi:phosphate transport system protein